MRSHSLLPLALLTLIAACASREARLMSPIPSSIEGLRITNVHLVDEEQGRVWRGMRPRDRKDVRNLQDKLGMNEVLIFRAPSKTLGVQEEIDDLSREGLGRDRIHVIPFEWNRVPSFETACRQSFEALALMKRARETQGRSLFVHCTVGEDRTGYIAALYKIAFKGLDTKTAFRDEMCARGYAEGDPEKPAKVSQIVHETLTPLFLKMSDLARRHPEAFRKLDTRLCQADPWLAANAKHVPSFEDQKEQFRCANPPAR